MAFEVARFGMGGRWACRTGGLGVALPHGFLRLCALPDALLVNPLPVLGSCDCRRKFAESHRGLRGIEERKQTTLVNKLAICYVGTVGSLPLGPLRVDRIFSEPWASLLNLGVRLPMDFGPGAREIRMRKDLL